VGIIDAGRIVAEGTPSELKAEIGRPTVQVAPADPYQREAIAKTLDRFGSPVEAEPGRVAVRLDVGYDLADVVRALDADDLKVAHLELDEPSLDDVFLAKTGHRLEGQAEAQPEPIVA
jgi:ABC-2 type transport system ATP-binding protein